MRDLVILQHHLTPMFIDEFMVWQICNSLVRRIHTKYH